MREILFRAKTVPDYKDIMTGKIIKTPKWIYGYVDLGYMHDCGVPIISDEKGNKAYKCQYESIGQFTGLTDKNGKKIFEGDIVKTESDLWHGENKKERVTRIGEVIYDEKFCQFGLNIKGFSKCFTLKRWKGDFNEVIGNIHDNPELLKGGE